MPRKRVLGQQTKTNGYHKTESTEKPKFRGFRKPEKNYFEMPNEWTDITYDIHSIAEIKVLEYLLRHTWGYSKDDHTKFKVLAIDEFCTGRKRRDGSRMDRGTGLSDRSVRTAIDKLQRNGYLEIHTDDSDKGRIKKGYKLRLFEDTPCDQDDADSVDTFTDEILSDVQISTGKSYHPGGKELPPRGERVTSRSEKDTLERNKKKDTPRGGDSSNGDFLNDSVNTNTLNKESVISDDEQSTTHRKTNGHHPHQDQEIEQTNGVHREKRPTATTKKDREQKKEQDITDMAELLAMTLKKKRKIFGNVEELLPTWRAELRFIREDIGEELFIEAIQWYADFVGTKEGAKIKIPSAYTPSVFRAKMGNILDARERWQEKYKFNGQSRELTEDGRAYAFSEEMKKEIWK